MLQINRKSWHYRFLRGMLWCSLWRNSRDPGSLCTYFWALVLSPFLVLLTGSFFVLGAVAIVGVLLGPFASFALWFWGFDPFGNDSPWRIVGAFGIMGGCAYVGAGLIFAFHLLRSGWSSARENSDTLRLVGEYARARKQKLCPLIEYVE